jgi:NRPS condensation-like uncharacterized protein
MTFPRALSPTERMVDVLDRAYTMNFVTVARLRPSPSADSLRRALDRLVLRHPLLGAKLARRDGGVFFEEGPAPIPHHQKRGERAEMDACVAACLGHRVWPDDGPRAELFQITHAHGASTLLLNMHHVVGDGSSGIIAMRDLITYLAQPQLVLPVLDAPTLQAFLPHDLHPWRTRVQALSLALGEVLSARPYRLRQDRPDDPSGRRSRQTSLRFPKTILSALAARAHAEETTVHGVLSAAALRGVVRAAHRTRLHARMVHPVDMRRYLREVLGCALGPGEAVGNYVSSVDTNHAVELAHPVGKLAREVSSGIRESKARHVPLLTAPVLGPLLTRGVNEAGDLPHVRDKLERHAMHYTCGLTNLGHLEPLGVRQRVGPMFVERLYFAASSSVLSSIGAAVSTFAGELTLVLSWTEPQVQEEEAAVVAASIAGEVRAYARTIDPLADAPRLQMAH